jgi:shikimate dehydrogenase
VPFQVESFSDFWCDVVTSGRLEALGLSIEGLTVASPYKEAVLQVAGASSPISSRVGAANVFVRENGQWKADTTDPEGVVLALRNRCLSLKGRKAAVVGCGGAGRAVAAAFDQCGANVTLVNRGWERGRLASQLLDLPVAPLSSFSVRGYSILVNATPVGRDDDRMPFDLRGLSEDAIVVDLVYGSKPTALVSNAKALGRSVVDGREVLLIQVLCQFRKMTGQDMPADLAFEVLGRNTALTAATSNSQAQGGIMSNPLSMMTADAKQVEPDLTPLLGAWMNVNPRTDYISGLTVVERGGRLFVQAYGADPTDRVDWGEAEATPYAGETLEAAGFHTRYDFGESEIRVAANYKLGILVIQTYTSFRNASDRRNRFAREFFHQQLQTEG